MQLVQKFVVHQPEDASPIMAQHVALVDESGAPYGGSGAATVDTLGGATETGKGLMKAESAEAARAAIGAGTSSFSGSYNDLSDKPSIPTAYKLPAATSSALGGVKQAAATASVASADAAAAAGDTVTKAEFDAVVTLLNEVKKQLNAHLSAAKAAGQMA